MSNKTPIIALNLKVFEESFTRLDLLLETGNRVSEETGVRIIIAPPNSTLSSAVRVYGDVFAQSADVDMGQFTGTNPVKGLKILNIKGTLINHSENKILLNKIARLVAACKENSLESLVCTATNLESRAVSVFKPTMIAVEPPELIGTGISVSKAKPEVVETSVNLVRELNKEVIILCGAGISNGMDVKRAIELGSQGVLLASAYVKADNPYHFLTELATSV